MQRTNILFVCTGNSCRSIMAEAYLLKKAEERSLTIDVRSAGTTAVEGLAPADLTQEVLAEEHISSEGLASSAFTSDLADWADMILVMEPFHRHKILQIAPWAADKVHYLAGWAEGHENDFIPDPIGGQIDLYRRTLGVVEDSVEGLIKWLEKR